MTNPIHNYRRKQPKKQKWFHSNYGNCLSTLLLLNRVNIVRPRNNEYNYAVNMHIAWLNPLFQRQGGLHGFLAWRDGTTLFLQTYYYH